MASTAEPRCANALSMPAATSEMFRQVFNDVARLQEAIREDIGPLAST